jgi:predicted permease
MPVVVAQAWQSWKSAGAVFALAVIAFAVGIGSTTAIYTVVNAVMLKPLAYEHGERYAQLFSATVGDLKGRGSLNLADLLVYQQAQSFDLFGWFKPQNFNLTSPGPPQHVEGAAVTTRLARNLGIQPMLGQWFQDEHGAVISRALWRRLGGDSKLLGSAIVLNGRPFTLTGVMPDRFRLPEVTPGGENARTDVWIGLDPDGKGQDRGDGFLFSYVRLKPGVTFAQAEAEVKNVAAEIARKTPAQHQGYTAALDPLSGLIGKSIRPTLLLLLGAAGVLLLITSANVAALLLARAVARARDTAIRVALGAGRRQLALQYFIEGLIVSLAGAALGVLASIGLVRGVVAMATEYIPRAEEVAIDWRVLLAALGTAALASALSSLAPLWQATRMAPNAVLTEGVRASNAAAVPIARDHRNRLGLRARSRQRCADRASRRRDANMAGVRHEKPADIRADAAGCNRIHHRPSRPTSDETRRRAEEYPWRHRRRVRQPGAARRMLSVDRAVSRRTPARPRPAGENGLHAHHARILRDDEDSAQARTTPDL